MTRKDMIAAIGSLFGLIVINAFIGLVEMYVR